MAQRRRVRRKVSRGRSQVRRSPSASASAARTEAKQSLSTQSGLLIGGVLDPAEEAADRMADQVMRMPSAGSTIHRKCEECEVENKKVSRQAQEPVEEETVQTKATPSVAPIASGASAVPASPNATKAIHAMGTGHPLTRAERSFFEPRFGADLSSVRVHDSSAADKAAVNINARAFTLGNDVAFANGERQSDTTSSRRLLAHELAHVVGNRDSASMKELKRVPTEKPAVDPLCEKYEIGVERLFIELDIENLAKRDSADVRLSLIQGLKKVHRCGTDLEKTEIREFMVEQLGEAKSAEIWAESKTAFGGHRGVYPGYYNGKSWLNRLGVTETEAFEQFNYPESSIDPAIFDPRAKKPAKAIAGTLEYTDILYFYGHQYAQYGNPGAFANGNQDQFVDLKALAGEGDFSRVKLIISTSCATLCKEAIEVFAPLFPNAVILGYRKSAPEKGGTVRHKFDKAIKGLKKPLLLDEPVDVSSIIGVWKSVVKGQHPNESKRLPGYYQGGMVHYLERGSWASGAATDAANSCRVKGTTIQEARD